MIGDATLKLLVGVAVGVGLYYNYKKKKVYQQRLDEPIKIGHNPLIPFALNPPHKKYEDKQHTSLKPTNQLPIF